MDEIDLSRILCDQRNPSPPSDGAREKIRHGERSINQGYAKQRSQRSPSPFPKGRGAEVRVCSDDILTAKAPMKKLTHIDSRGQARMVDVSAKPVVLREAVARGEVRLHKETIRLIESQAIAKGNVLATARVAGIQAAKRTGELIPLCHPLPITHCEVDFAIPKSRDRIIITASAKIAAQTGVEMEALMAVSLAALTIYDMCKAVDKTMRITDIELVSKTKK